MEITINTPALLFPAITLLMLAYTNRFLALANLIRKLHDEYLQDKNQHILITQLRNLRRRINMIRSMQGLAILSFIFCVISMYLIFQTHLWSASIAFAGSLICLGISLIISFVEILLSTKALELELSDIEELTDTSLFSSFLKWREERKNNQ